MKKTKLISLIVLSALVFGILGSSAFAYHEYIYTFDGDSHTGGCHAGSTNDGESVTGSLDVTITPSGNLEPLQVFTISVAIDSFTELDNSAYQNRTTIGISKEFGDNSAFLRGVENKSFSRRIKVDADGNLLTPTELGAIAPETPGEYTLVIVAIAAMNQSTEAGYNFIFAQGSVTVTVAAPANGGGGGPTIAGDILLITVGSAFVVTMVVVIKKKHKIKKD